MHILMIGGTGNISASFTRLLLAQRHQVTLFNRGHNRSFEALGARYLIGDLEDAAATAASLRPFTFDVVADFICYNPAQARRDFEWFQGRTGQFIFISSCTVYQKPQRAWRPITEDMPLKNPFSAYAQGKIACEQYFLERCREDDFPVTIVRPSHTYGETRLLAPLMPLAGSHWTLAERMLGGKEIIVHGDGRSLWTVTHSDDFATGLAGLAGNRAALGHAFHITSDEVLTWNEILSQFGQVLGVQPRLAPLPSIYIEAMWPRFQGMLTGDKAESLVFDNSKLKRFVPGFGARISFAEGIRRSVAWFRAHPDACAIDESYNADTERLISHFGRP